MVWFGLQNVSQRNNFTAAGETSGMCVVYQEEPSLENNSQVLCVHFTTDPSAYRPSLSTTPTPGRAVGHGPRRRFSRVRREAG